MEKRGLWGPGKNSFSWLQARPFPTFP